MARNSKITDGGYVHFGKSSATRALIKAAQGGGGSAVWGDITGTLSNQADLQNELDNKANSADVLLKDGTVSLDGGYTPTNPQDITTKGYTDAQDALKANVVDVLLKDGSVDLDAGYTPASPLSVASKEYVDNNTPTGVLLSDGSVDLDTGYVPTNPLSLVSKEYVDALLLAITNRLDAIEADYAKSINGVGIDNTTNRNVVITGENLAFSTTNTAALSTAVAVIPSEAGATDVFVVDNTTNATRIIKAEDIDEGV